MEHSKAFRLKNGGKTTFFDCHRRFLPMNHPYRFQSDKFLKGVIERLPPLPRPSGLEMLTKCPSILRDIMEVHHIMIKFLALVLNTIG